MLKIDDNLLQTIGLGALPTEDKRGLLTHIYETLEMRVGMRLADQMTNEQLDEFETYFEAKDDAGAFKWLETNFPNYKDIVNEEFEKLKTEVQNSAPQILAAAQANAASQPPEAEIVAPAPQVTQPAVSLSQANQPQQQPWPPQQVAPAQDAYAVPQPTVPPAPQPYQPPVTDAQPQQWVPPAPAESVVPQQPLGQPTQAPWQTSPAFAAPPSAPVDPAPYPTPAVPQWQPAAQPSPPAPQTEPQQQSSPMTPTEQPAPPAPENQFPPQQYQPAPPAWTPDQPPQSN